VSYIADKKAILTAACTSKAQRSACNCLPHASTMEPVVEDRFHECLKPHKAHNRPLQCRYNSAIIELVTSL